MKLTLPKIWTASAPALLLVGAQTLADEPAANPVENKQLRSDTQSADWFDAIVVAVNVPERTLTTLFTDSGETATYRITDAAPAVTDEVAIARAEATGVTLEQSISLSHLKIGDDLNLRFENGDRRAHLESLRRQGQDTWNDLDAQRVETADSEMANNATPYWETEEYQQERAEREASRDEPYEPYWETDEYKDRDLSEFDADYYTWVDATVVDINPDERKLTLIVDDTDRAQMYTVDAESNFILRVNEIERDTNTGVTMEDDLVFEDLFEGSRVMVARSRLEDFLVAQR